MPSFSPQQFSVQAVAALQQAGAVAARARALSLSPTHLLYGILAQPASDAAGVLRALGHDPEAMTGGRLNIDNWPRSSGCALRLNQCPGWRWISAVSL